MNITELIKTKKIEIRDATTQKTTMLKNDKLFRLMAGCVLRNTIGDDGKNITVLTLEHFETLLRLGELNVNFLKQWPEFKDYRANDRSDKNIGISTIPVLEQLFRLNCFSLRGDMGLKMLEIMCSEVSFVSETDNLFVLVC